MYRILISLLFAVSAFTASSQCGNGCFQFRLLPIVTGNHNSPVSITFCVKTNCSSDLSHVAFELPIGQVALTPSNGGVYKSKFNYTVENATNNPFRSIKFEATGSVDGYKNGVEDCFTFTVSRSVYNQMLVMPYMRIEAKAGLNIGDASFDFKTGLEIPTCTLPVSFGWFTAERRKGAVDLKWQTLSEQNNQGFSVERYNNGNWKTVGSVATKATSGNSTTATSYSFTDEHAIKESSVYRIVQKELNGNARYSETRLVAGMSAEAGMVLYPNPSSDGQAKIIFNSTAARNIVICNAVGQVVKKYENYTETILRVDGLRRGFFTVTATVRSTGLAEYEKLIVR